jgi:hypothetical protein
VHKVDNDFLQAQTVYNRMPQVLIENIKSRSREPILKITLYSHKIIKHGYLKRLIKQHLNITE